MDTSGDFAVLALAHDDGFLRAARVFEGRRTLSRRLIGEMDRLLIDNGETLATLSAICVGLGPGSFTGVRVGVTTAKTLAQAQGTPLIGIDTLDAHAAAVSAPDAGTAVVPVLPSRRGEVYAAVYYAGIRSEEPFAVAADSLEERLSPGSNLVLCGRSDVLPPETKNGGIARFHQPWTPPEGLAMLGSKLLASGAFEDPLSLVPRYAAPPLITVPRNRRLLGGGKEAD
jgi:tRNA threonylcarbamoyladenosine biosynthesis protein TsaB